MSRGAFGLLLLEGLLKQILAGAGEEVFDGEAGLGGSLEALVDAVGLGELDGAVEGDLALLLHLGLVADEVDAHVLAGVLLDFFEPLHEGDECLVARDVVGEEDAVRAAVENAGDGLEAFLAGGVPDLDLDYLPVDSEVVAAELDANGDLVLRLELVVHDPLQEARLAHSRVPNDNQLEQVVVLSQRLILDHLVRHVLQLVDLVLLHNS